MDAKLYKVLDQYHLYDGDKAIATTIVGNPMLLPNLSKQNCDEIFGVVDVEKLANDSFDKKFNKDSEQLGLYDVGFINGFNKAMELNKGKVFTLEDMRKGIQFGEDNTDMDSFDTVISDKEVNEFIQSLQQPTEINVEIVTEEPLVAKARQIHGEYVTSKLLESAIFPNPKLDSEGNLILKKI
jgi:hypothetical protein